MKLLKAAKSCGKLLKDVKTCGRGHEKGGKEKTGRRKMRPVRFGSLFLFFPRAGTGIAGDLDQPDHQDQRRRKRAVAEYA